MTNVNINIQYDTPSKDGLTFAEIDRIRQSVNAPLAASITAEKEEPAYEINIHWNDSL